MTDPTVAQFARRLANLEATVRSINGPQLAFSSIETGALREYDGDTLVAQYGLQYDGTHAAAILNSPYPPRPSSPLVVGVPGGLLVGWDGFFADGPTVVAPMDFVRVDLVVGAVGMDPIAVPPSNAFVSPRGGSIFVSLEPGSYDVALITRNAAGLPSTSSTIVTGVAAAITGTSEDTVARAMAQDAIDDAAAASAAAAAAQLAADSASTIYRQSTAPASGMVANDMWIDSDDGLLYVYTTSWVLSADQRVATLVTSNATKISLFSQTSAPSTTGRTIGDIWIDTDDGNKIYDWTGAWTARTWGAAAISATARQLGAVTIYRQSTAPASGMITNDMWVDSDDGLLYIYTGSWTLSADQRVATLVTSNATKITAFYQTSAPSTSGRTTGDLWFDTDDGFRPYIWNGAWTTVRDTTIATADAKAVQAAADAAAAASAAAAAQGTANTALTSANGKNAVTHADFAPTNQANTADDIWYVHAPLAEGSKIIGMYTGLGGTSWRSDVISHQVIGSVDLGTATVGKLSANYLESGVLAAAITLTGMIIAGSPTGARVVLDTAGLRQYDGSGNMVINLPTDPSLPSTFEGAVIAQALTTNGFFTIRGTTNEISEGAEVRLAAGISPPAAAPSVAIGYETYDPGRWSAGQGWEPVGMVGAADDANLYGALSNQGATNSRLIAPSSKYYQFPFTTDNVGDVHTEWTFSSATVCYVGSSTKIVGFGWRYLDGNAGQGAMASFDADIMNSGGSTSPSIGAFQTMTADTGTYRTRVGRVFSPIGSSTWRDRICIAVRRQAQGDIVLRIYQVTALAFVQQGSDIFVTDPLDAGEDLAGVEYGSSAKMGFPGADQNIWVVHSTNKTRVWNSGGTARITNFEFVNAGSSQRMQAWGDAATNSFTAFRAQALTDDSPVTKFTNTHWDDAGDSAVWWVSNTWYDSDAAGTGTHETTQSPRASITMRKRAGLTVTVPPFPPRPTVQTTDDVVASRVYIGRGATDPGRAAMDLVGTPVAPTRTLFVGTQRAVWLPVTTSPPAANGFVASTPGKIMSADGTSVVMSGDGKLTAAGVLFDGTKPGFTSSPMADQEFVKGAGSATTATSTTAIAMGTSQAGGTFVAPPSGKVNVIVTAQLRHSVAGQWSAVGWELRTGAVVGSGTLITAFNVDDAALNRNTQDVRSMQTKMISGLTPGSTYNIRTMQAAQSATGTADNARLLLQPSA